VKIGINAGVFWAGLVLAGILAVMQNTVGAVGLVLLAILGLVMGVLNVTKGERVAYLIATIALFVISLSFASVTNESQVGPIIDALLNNVAVFAGFGAIPVALMAIHNIGSRR